jgi:leucyl-tRNA synthetase
MAINQEYRPEEVEKSAQEYWQKNQSFSVCENLNKEKFYSLCMFPYPSGSLHMGHVRNYTMGDVIARYQRSLGKNVLQPIGWDAFGLPAENAAIKNDVPPAEWTEQNIESMREQIKRLGFAYDWKRELATCSPDYYRWEQWFFLKLYEKGLVYKKNAVVNWDPVDNTVLANEQVVDGRGWRSGALVERREISQWFLKITSYADELLESLEELTEWPEQVKTMQANWIGRSQGVEISFSLPEEDAGLKVYTTRADTFYGVSFIAIAAEHPLASQAAINNSEVSAFIEKCRETLAQESMIETQEKIGIFTGLYATHPLSKEPVPIYIANFVLMSYAHGAVMGVPAHDERDYDFAKKYDIPIKQVIKENDQLETSLPFTEPGILIDSGDFSDLPSLEAKEAIAEHLIAQGIGTKKTNYRLRDWGVSRQRYWGTPIPMICCDNCGHVPVPEEDLPIKLPTEVSLTGKGSPLANCPDFINTTCPKCGDAAKRETDTFDTFVESSWYYARFCCVMQENAMLDDRANYWTPVDQYIGGIEHAVMHLLYARFFHKLLRDFGLVNSNEPFKSLLTQGMVLKDGAKMSKSKGNVVNPNTLIDKYGSDTARFFIIFAAPPEQSLEWSDSAVEGSFRFLKKLWNFCLDKPFIQERNSYTQEPVSHSVNWNDGPEALKKARYELHNLLSQASYDYTRNQFNTAASSCMKQFNCLSKLPVESNEHYQALVHEGISILLRVLAPICPHITHHLWQQLGFHEAIIDAPWPKTDKLALKLNEVEYVIQINGKLKAKLALSPKLEDKEIIDKVLQNSNLKSHLTDKTIKKTIVVANRKLVNIVVA